jgi:ABC-type transport system involved in multi-copper enzyme maturation permease subunit
MKQRPALALFERALRLETRSPLMCWSRAGLLGISLLVLFPIQAMARAGWYGAPGLRFLGQMVWVNLIFITLAGLSYFASAITEEKEEMTLGLLRMTELNPIAILLGKSTSRLIGALLLLLVQVPFIMLAVTLGGVGLSQILAAYGTLLAYMFFLCNLSLLFSVVFRNTTTAAVFALIVLVLFFFGHYWAAYLEQSIASSYSSNLNRGAWPFLTAMIGFWHDATPSERLGAIFQTGFTGPVVGFQIWSNLAMGVFFFLVAWIVFDPCTREEKDSAPARRWLWSRTSRRSRIPSHVLGAKAITWKDFTFLGGGKFGLLLKFLVMAVLVAVINIFVLESGSRRVTWEVEGWTLIWVSLISTMVWLALEASRIFKDEVRWKTLSSLMTLPISVPELAYRKVAGALIGTLPLLAFFVLGVIMVPDKVGDFLDAIFRESGLFGMLMVAILQFILFLHLTAFLSLVIKRGALPLAIAIQYLGGSFFLGFVSFFLFAGGAGVASFVIGFVCLVLIVILHRAIGYRLVRAAAEE